MTSTLNVTKKKQYTLTLRGKVQDVGFRGYVQDLSKRFSIGGIIYNVGDDEMKILCEGDVKSVNQFYKQLRKYSLAEITKSSIEEGFQVPYPVYRAVSTLEQELYSKLDLGVRLLSDISNGISETGKDMRSGFGGVNKGIADMRKDTSQIPALRKDLNSGFKGTQKLLKEISRKL